MSGSDNQVSIVLSVNSADFQDKLKVAKVTADQLGASVTGASAGIDKLSKSQTSATSAATQLAAAERAVGTSTISQTQAVTSATQAAAQHTAGAKVAAEATDGFGHSTARARTELIVLAHELSQGNYSRFSGSLMVLAESMDATALVTSPLAIGVAAVTGAIGTLGYAAIKGAQDQQAFQDAVRLTGGALGLTRDQFESLVVQVGTATDGKIAQARSVFLALANTGRFTADSIGPIARAIIDVADVSHQEVDKVTADFAKMADGVAKWAAEHDKQYHSLTAAQLEHIQKLEDEGRASEAMIETSRLLSTSMENQKTPVTGLSKDWDDLWRSVNGGWDDLKKNLHDSGDFGLSGLKSYLDVLRGAGAGPAGPLAYNQFLAQPAVNNNNAQKRAAEVAANAADTDATLAAGERSRAAAQNAVQRIAELSHEIALNRQLTSAEKEQIDLQVQGGKVTADAAKGLLESQDGLEKRRQAQIQAAADAKTAAAEAQRDREYDLKLDIQAEENQNKKIIAARQSLAIANAELAAGGRITEAQKDLIREANGYLPLSNEILKNDLTELDTKQKQLETQKKLQQAAEKAVDEIKRGQAEALKGQKGGLKDGATFGGINAAQNAATGAENDRYTKQTDALNSPDGRNQLIKEGEDVDKRLEQAALQHQQALTKIETAGNEARKKLIQDYASVSADALGNLATTAEAFGKQGFEVYKAAAVGQAIVSSIASAQNSYESLSSIPYVGPALGIAAAAAALAAGYARVQQIESTQYGGGRELGGSVAAGMYYDVGEKDKAELYNLDSGKQILIPGDEGGTVVPGRRVRSAPADGAMSSGSWQLVMHNHGEPLDARIRSVVGNVVTVEQMPTYGQSIVKSARTAVAQDAGNAGSSLNKNISAVHGTKRNGNK